MAEDAGEGGEMGEAAPMLGEAEEEEGEHIESEPEPPREEKEMLFLIEFLVDTLTIHPENLLTENVDPCQLQGQTCLTLTFLHFPPMNICEKDLDPSKQTGEDEIKFNCGKSLMFALSNTMFDNPPPIYLEVAAFKSLPHGCFPSKFPIGATKICLSELFRIVFDRVEDKPDKLPLSKSIKDTYQLTGAKPGAAAECQIYIRLTCMGQNVVTEFQRGGETEEEPYLFKSKESDKVYECKAKDIGSCEDLAPPCPGWGEKVPCEEKETKGKRKKRKSGGIDDDDYEEFGAEVNGHSLVIRVQKSDRQARAARKSQKINLSEFCDCDIPMPACLPPGSARGGASGVGGGAGPSGVPPGGVGLANGNQIIFQVPPSQNLCKKGDHNAIVYNVSTCDEGEAHGHTGKSSFRIVPDANSGEPGGPNLPNDPEKDVFVLRIGKKGEYDDAKGKLELELRTPKQKIEEPPKGPYMIDREVQTEQDKKKKGKKGKKK